MGKARRELIECHDCGNAVSLSATHCPNCGSREPAGPYRMSASDRRRLNIEERNDRNALIIAGSCCAIGVLYGVASGNGVLSAIFWAACYGGVGLLVGVPIAFAVNMTRWLVR